MDKMELLGRRKKKAIEQSEGRMGKPTTSLLGEKSTYDIMGEPKKTSEGAAKNIADIETRINQLKGETSDIEEKRKMMKLKMKLKNSLRK